MIFIACALYVEASALIKHFSLKKDIFYTNYQVFSGENITVIITGAGMTPSTISVSDFLARNTISKHDIFINYGSCGGLDVEIGTIYLINHITDSTTGRTYVPDILIKHSLNEDRLMTSPVPISSAANLKCKLFDMEAAALYQCALKHFQTHRIFFIKVVSDIIGNSVASRDLAIIMTAALSRILQLIDSLSDYSPEPVSDISESDKTLILNLSNSLRLTKTQQSELLCYFRFYASTGHSVTKFINIFKGENTALNIKNKTEGKKYYELITRELIL